MPEDSTGTTAAPARNTIDRVKHGGFAGVGEVEPDLGPTANTGEVAAHVNHLVRNGILENEQGRFQTTTTFRSLPADRLP